MGKMEEESRKKARRNNLQRFVLNTIATAGVLSVALLAPNTISALKKFGMIPGQRQKEVIYATRKRLVRSGFLTYDKRGFLRLTEKGKKKLRALELRNYQIEKPRWWDKKWRVLIFDISEKKRGTRSKIRHTLSTIGFMRLQDSVWVYPYPCDDYVALLKADFSIGRELLYLIVDSIEFDRDLRKKFGLKED